MAKKYNLMFLRTLTNKVAKDACGGLLVLFWSRDCPIRLVQVQTSVYSLHLWVCFTFAASRLWLKG